MLSNGFDAPLRLELKASKILIRFQLLVHLLAIIALTFPSDIPLVIKFVLYAFIVLNAVMSQRKYKDSASCAELFIWQKTSTWIEVKSGREYVWCCQQDNLVTPWFVVVKLKNEKKRTLLIFKDQCDAQSFRRLRVKLKYFQGVAVMPTDAS